mmetsp:Transcript_90058/g.285157  ORF Transcript_90058/g.285157 Transcript_90058/m.285157 type:complete len:219 (+) Transcript_90058:521-1177(+)
MAGRAVLMARMPMQSGRMAAQLKRPTARSANILRTSKHVTKSMAAKAASEARLIILKVPPLRRPREAALCRTRSEAMVSSKTGTTPREYPAEGRPQCRRAPATSVAARMPVPRAAREKPASKGGSPSASASVSAAFACSGRGGRTTGITGLLRKRPKTEPRPRRGAAAAAAKAARRGRTGSAGAKAPAHGKATSSSNRAAATRIAGGGAGGRVKRATF